MKNLIFYQTLYSHIEALALDLEQPRNIEDSTLPDLEIQKRLLDNLSEDFKQTFGDVSKSNFNEHEVNICTSS